MNVCSAVWLILKIIEIYFIYFQIVNDRKKKAEITLVQEDFDEIKLEHEAMRTPNTLFNIGLSMSQIILRQKTREKVPVRTIILK